MEQGFYGTAQPGSAIPMASPYGVAETTANGEGKWETTLKMADVPPGTKVAVRITSNTSDRVREFSLLRPAPAASATIEFTAKLGADGQANTPMTQGFLWHSPTRLGDPRRFGVGRCRDPGRAERQLGGHAGDDRGTAWNNGGRADHVEHQRQGP